jgi:hypothetical protein
VREGGALKEECMHPKSSACTGLVRDLYVFEAGELGCKKISTSVLRM